MYLGKRTLFLTHSYPDRKPMEQLGKETLDLVIKVASGQRSAGERSGHSQVQLWRNWRQVSNQHLNYLSFVLSQTILSF